MEPPGAKDATADARWGGNDTVTDISVGEQDRQRVLRLGDGRALAYLERGNPEGTAILEFHGLPNPRHADTVSEAFLWDRRIRRIAVDRPGVGFSDPQPGRTLLDWPGDVAEVADALGIDRFAVLGVSGGAPHAMACAFALPDRVAAVTLVSGMGPPDRPGAFAGMNRAAARVLILAGSMPWLARLLVGFVVAVDRFWPGTVLRGLLKAAPERDRKVASRPEVRESLLESYALAFRQGTAGQVRDWATLASPWGFRLDEVNVPVSLFHGEVDDRVPLHHAEHLARVIPDAHLTTYPDEGHMIMFDRAEEILDALVGKAV